MARRLRYLGILVALGAGAVAAPAGPAQSSSAPLARAFAVASRDDPHVGQPFVSHVLVLPASVARGLVAVRARCLGTVLGRAVPARVLRVPARAAVPSALLCRFAIPRDRLGWTFRGRMTVEAERRLRGGGIELVGEEGRTTAWIVQP